MIPNIGAFIPKALSQVQSALPQIQNNSLFQGITSAVNVFNSAQGAMNAFSSAASSFGAGTGTAGSLGQAVSIPMDHRVRIRARPGTEGEIYGYGPSAMLNDTNGMVFPYTPQFNLIGTANYSSLGLVHVNQDYNYYSNTSNAEFVVGGLFTAQNTQQANYCVAVIHFLRTVSKMHFGVSDQRRGLPPPMLVFDGYGDMMFNQLPVFIKTFTIDFLNDVDYVEVQMNTGTAWVPVQFNLSVSITVQNPPAKWRDEFNLDAFRNGQLLGATKGWI